ncbi:MAG: carbamoyl-phosphate synthase large subunit [Sulfurimonas sp.]|jgi:carbamoyl-phosphate synthase large subunit|uniref:ATP-grasp domain-containing protein n=1 Tax=Sulfurimonas sp. TaxID=2022749 RepID=UPI0039E2960E
MKPINILITSAGGDIGINVINILSEQYNESFRIIATDLKEKIFSFNKICKFYTISKTSNPNYKIEVLNIIKENCIKIIIPISEAEIVWFNNNRDMFDKLNIKVLINNKTIINGFFDKLQTSLYLNNLSVNTPQTYLLTEYNQEISFPIIIKSRYSIHSKSIYIINNIEQLQYLEKTLKNHAQYIVQKYIGSSDEEYTTAVYRDNNKFEVITFKRQLTGGMTSSAKISNETQLYKYAKTISEHFNLHGSINIQTRKVGTEFYIFEINPRISSTIYIRNYFGFQDLLWWLNNSLSNSIQMEHKILASHGSALLGYQYQFFKEDLDGNSTK